MVALEVMVTLIRAVGDFVPPHLKWAAVVVQIYLVAAFTIARELISELLWPKAHRECVDAIMASPFMRKRIDKMQSGTPPMALVTGADGTIGSQIVFLLIKLGFTVSALSGSATKMRQIIAEWSAIERARVKVYQVNFVEPIRMQTYLENLCERIDQIDVVVLSAGTMLNTEGPVNGFEHHEWVNVISQAMVVKAMEEKMAEDVRIIALSSVCAHLNLCEELTEEELLTSGKFGLYEAYARSKFNLAVYCEQLARDYSTSLDRPSRIVVSAHPGVVPGGLYRHVNPLIRWISDSAAHLTRSPVMAATLVLHTALRSDAKSGAYYEDRTVTALRPDIANEKRHAIYKRIEAAVDEALPPRQQRSSE